MKALENREFLAFCKLLFFKSLKKQKIQAIYFEIYGLYFKISALYFLRSALCFFQHPKCGILYGMFCRIYRLTMQIQFNRLRTYSDCGNDSPVKVVFCGFSRKGNRNL